MARDFWFCGFGQFLVRFFGFSTLKLQVFGLGVLRGLRVFSNLVFGFRFWSTMMAVFRIFLASAFDGFSGFPEEVTRCSHAKALIPRHQSQLEECMASLTVSLAGVVWVVTCYQADYGKLKITSKQKTLSQIITPLGYTILWTLTLDGGPTSFYSSISPFRCGNNIAFTRSVHKE